MDEQFIIEGRTGSETRINGKDYLYFAGTGYFQLGSHPEMIKAASDATLKYGIASGTSRAITGTTPLLQELEKSIADFFKTEDAVYLPSGYLSNIAGLQALNELDKFDVIFVDEGSHYCLLEGTATVNKPVVSFAHRDVSDLKIKLDKFLESGQRPLIASDGLFPLWAKVAPLTEYLELAGRHDGAVWIDDAHGVGILGDHGRGTFEHLKLKSDRLFMGATLSKAFGAYGGFIPGSSDFIDTIRRCSVFTGSSSPVYAAVAAGIKGLEIVSNNPQLREQLWGNARYLKQKMKSLGIAVDNNNLPVVTFTCSGEEKMQEIQESMMDKGIYIQFAKYKGSGNGGVLRIVVFSGHTKQQIDYLIQNLEQVTLFSCPSRS